MTVEANQQLDRRWLLERWNGNLAITDQILTPGFVGSWPGRAWSTGPRSWPT